MNNIIIYETLAGQYLDNVIENIISLANTKTKTVIADFNNIKLIAVPGLTMKEDLLDYFDKECKRRSEEYWNSEEGKLQKKKREEDILKAQETINKCLEELPRILKRKDTKEILSWLKVFSDPADRIGVSWIPSNIFCAFSDAGYEENAFVGEGDLLRNSKECFGLYIIGRAMNCINMGMAPHPVIYKFISEYEEMKVDKRSDLQKKKEGYFRKLKEMYFWQRG